MVWLLVACFGFGQNFRPSPRRDLKELGRGQDLSCRRSWKAE